MATKQKTPSSFPHGACAISALPDGSASVLVLGKATIYIRGPHGEMKLSVSGPDMFFAVDDSDKEPGRQYKFKGVWQLAANGVLRGWWMDTKGRRQWIPAKRTAKKGGE